MHDNNICFFSFSTNGSTQATTPVVLSAEIYSRLKKKCDDQCIWNKNLVDVYAWMTVFEMNVVIVVYGHV